jgi:hypothetical protein
MEHGAIPTLTTRHETILGECLCWPMHPKHMSEMCTEKPQHLCLTVQLNSKSETYIHGKDTAGGVKLLTIVYLT